MTRPVSFRQTDLTRAIRAALEAGLAEGTFTVEAEGDKVRVLTHPAAQTKPQGSELERWRARRGRSAA